MRDEKPTRELGQGSRQQIGCFAAVLMVASAGYMLRLAFRRLIFETDPLVRQRIVDALSAYWAFAAAVLVVAVFALYLRRWALVGYFGVAAAAILFALSGHGGWYVATPLVIGMVTVAGLLFFGRQYL